MNPDDQSVAAVSVTALSRQLSEVVARARAGERIVVTKHGLPVALIISVDDGVAAIVADSARIAARRAEAQQELEAAETLSLRAWRASR
jgi:prevent-host-death family protein